MLVKISWKYEQKYQSYKCMKNCIEMWMKSIHFFTQFFICTYGGQLKQETCYSFTLLISYMVFDLFKMAVQLF